MILLGKTVLLCLWNKKNTLAFFSEFILMIILYNRMKNSKNKLPQTRKIKIYFIKPQNCPAVSLLIGLKERDKCHLCP